MTEAKTEAKKTEETEEEDPLPTGEIVYPAGFSVGYNRQSIAPEVFPIQTYMQFEHVGKSNHDPVQLTCTAICDGEKVFLLITVDLRGLPEGFVNYNYKIIERATGIPKEQVFINATHTHSAPDNAHFGEGENMKKWMALYYKRLERAVVLALHDLTPAEAYVGVSETDGVAFVRRYLMDDGSYMTNPGGKPGIPVAHETEADPELRSLRFDREGDAKDVLLVNWQSHYHGSFPDSVSADFVHYVREQVEKEMDVHFAYHSGAGANVNFKAVLPGEKKYNGIEACSAHIAETVKKAVAAEEKTEVGKLQFETVLYKGKAKESTTTIEFPLSAVTCGQLAFCAFPYEMFDTNGKEVRDASPCKTTFICSLTNGGFGYVPSAFAYPHGAYEVDISRFAPGSGEEFAQEMVRLLNVCKARD